MALIRPRLNDYYNLAFTQEEADFAIPFLDDDIPLYVDPFLLWKSPSQQDQALHTALISSFNYFGHLAKSGREPAAEAALIRLSECQEAGLGSARNKTGKRIGSGTAREILAQFSLIPQVKERGFEHIEEIQLFVDQVSKDRISDFTCSLLKSFLIDYTIDQSNRWGIPMSDVVVPDVFDFQKKRFSPEKLKLPINPANGLPVVLVPKRWLRFSPWIAFDDYFTNGFVKDGTVPTDRVTVLMFNRAHYDAVQTYVRQKERTQPDNPINIFKLKFINEKLEQANVLLVGNFKPFKEFSTFEDTALPSNSDVVMILSQYLNCLEGWRSANVHHDRSVMGWRWNADDADLRAEPASQFRKSPSK
jgi:hypothetical protein